MNQITPHASSQGVADPKTIRKVMLASIAATWILSTDPFGFKGSLSRLDPQFHTRTGKRGGSRCL